MRIRTIKPEFWSHPVMGRQSDASRLLAIGLLNLADDEGYFFADPKLVRNALRPFDDDSGITTVSLRDLSEIGYISVRDHSSHGPIGLVISFADHQVINKPKPSGIKELYEYCIDTVAIPESDGLERKGKEGIREQGKDTPKAPKGDEESDESGKGECRILPAGWQRMTASQRKQTRVNANSKTMNRIGKFFGRREGTKWTVAEAVALKNIAPDPADIAALEIYYLARIDREQDFRRRDLGTLLNNWQGELDRAIAYMADNDITPPQP